MKDEAISILFAGDLCIRGRTERTILESKSRDILIDILPVLQDKDISVVNLENPLTSGGIPIIKSGPNLRADPKCIDFLSCAYFDILSLANNHMGDFGPVPVCETISLLNEKNFMTVGAGSNLEEAKKPLIIEKKEKRIAVLSYAENEFGIAEVNTAGTSPLDPLSNIKEIQAAASKSDIVLVLIHGGNELNPVPNPRTIQICRSFADAGADAVIGTHPHCPQGMEIYNEAPIVYSLGNFLFDNKLSDTEDAPPSDIDSFWWKSFMVKITFGGGTAAGVEIIPYSFAPDATKITLLRGEERKDFLNYFQYLSGIIANEDELIRYWNAWCYKMCGTIVEDISKEWAVWADQGKLSQNTVELNNIVTCEALHEMLKNYLGLLYNGGIFKAREYVTKLNNLQKGILPNNDK